MASSRVLRSAFFLMALFAIWPLATSGQSSHSKKQTVKRTPLTSVEAVTDIDAPVDPDDPGAGGGVDAEGYFSRKLAAKVATCTDQIQSVGGVWARDQKLSVNKMDKQAGNLLMHMTGPDLNGFFELTYRVKLHDERARVTLFFYSQDGAQHEPAGIRELLKDYHVDTFQDRLTQALLCGGN